MTDLFICHASEDKKRFVDQLAQVIQDRGIKVWYDQTSIRIGDSLREAIDRGLATCDYGLVILSPSFFSKNWTRRELTD